MQDPPTDASLASTALIDSDHPAVRKFADEHAGSGGARERAVALYYAVRDAFRYDPYRIDLSPHGMRASTVLQVGHGWCVTKAALLAAVCRATGIPARLGFADVLNHLSTARMRATMKTDVFAWHGYTDLWLDGAWVKATPAFNVELCERFGLLPLEFDGTCDSIYHPFDRAGNRHMEYVLDRGRFDDVPLAQIAATFAQIYATPMTAIAAQGGDQGSDFLSDVERETGAGTGPAS